MGQPIMPIGPMRPYTYGRLGRPVASQFGPEAIGARFKARSGPAHSHLDFVQHRHTTWLPTWLGSGCPHSSRLAHAILLSQLF